MKNFAIKLVWFATIYVFVFAGLCQTNVPIPVLMALYCIGIPLIFLWFTLFSLMIIKLQKNLKIGTVIIR